MSSFNKVLLTEICRPKQWKTISTSDLLESGFPVYGANGKIGFYSKYTHENSTLMITCRGATCGNVHISEPKAYINGNAMALDNLNENVVDIGYLYRFLQKRGFNDVISGSAQPQITRQGLEKITVPLPPLLKQKCIAAILDKADAIRRKRQQTIDLTDQLLRSVFLDMFGDPVTNPKGWEKVKLDKLCDICRGGSPRPIQNYLGGNIPWIKIGDATKDNDIYIESTKEKIYESGLSKTRFLKPGALIFANCGVSLGFARILKIAGCIHDGWLSLEIMDKRLNQIFLLKAINQITKHFQTIAPDGTQPNLNTSIMKDFELILPPIELQEKFEKIVQKVNSMRKNFVKASDIADRAANSITQQAFSGALNKQTEST